MTARARATALLGGVVLPVVGLLAGCSAQPGQDAGASATPTVSEADPFDLGVGDCVDSTTGSGQVTEVPVVPCSEPHVGEAFAAVQMTGEGAFPGLDAVADAAAGCQEPFEQFIGAGLAGSTLQVTYFHPTEESWAKGDREILCIVSDPTRKVTGTLRGADR